MTPTSLFWIVVFIISVLLFFAAAGVIMVQGIKDLRDLLGRSDPD